jgi:hypothetical protein
LRAIGNPKMYKLTQQFFFRCPGSARRIVQGQTMKFSLSRSSIRPPLPMGLLGHGVCTRCGTNPSLYRGRPRTRTKNSDTGLGGNDDTAPNRHNCFISIVRPYVVSRSVPMSSFLKI